MEQPKINLETSSDSYRARTLRELGAFERRFRRFFELRPMALAALAVRTLAPSERRRIIRTPSGINLYLDPLSNLGKSILATGTYEPATAAVFESEIRSGDAVLDIGANEGYFSAVAGRLVGPQGTIVCVEPQSRLAGVIEINLAINAIQRYRIFQCAIGEDTGTVLRLNLYPEINTGASSFLRKYKLSRKYEDVQFASPELLLQEAGLERLDFVKVDVEGYEFKVVPALLPLISTGKIGKLFLDYHLPILASHGVDPRILHEKLIAAGMQPAPGSDEHFTSYILYYYRPSSDPAHHR